LKLLFGADRSPMAKLLGLPRILVFEFSAGLTFDVSKFDLRPATLPLLERQAALLKEQFTGVDVHVIGHTDSTGSAVSNRTLSVNRAQAVADYLSSQGIEKTRLRIQGLASDYPVAPNTTDEGKAANRRTELILAQ
jgi:outer membrane protein OmpA-like peptidoglycan-associated protein